MGFKKLMIDNNLLMGISLTVIVSLMLFAITYSSGNSLSNYTVQYTFYFNGEKIVCHSVEEFNSEKDYYDCENGKKYLNVINVEQELVKSK